MDMISNDVDKSISICIASYNMSDTIEESLQTITKNLPGNFEIVIVDQSNDGSKDIIDEISSNSDISFTKIYFDKPLGVGRARNIAVREATGDIVITHVDVDDWYDSRYFIAMSELYITIKEKRGSDFFLSGPNMNLSSKEFMLENYTLSSAPIGANEMEYVWRAYSNGDYVNVKLDVDASGRIKLSDRKNFRSRIIRTYLRQIGMYKIGYSTSRIIKQEIINGSWPLHSKFVRLALLPIAWFRSLFIETICDAPIDGKDFNEMIDESTYKLDELKDKYNINQNTKLDDLVNE